MFRPSKRTSPETRKPGVRSCIRFRQRMKVLLPHPEGPITEVTEFLRMSIVIFLSTWWSPNQAQRLFTFNAFSIARLSLLLPHPRKVPRPGADDQDHPDQYDRAGPRLVVPVFVRGNRVVEHLERDGGDRLVQPRLPELVSQGGEQKGGGFPDDPRHRQQDPGDDPPRGGPDRDEEGRLPPRD